MAGSEAMMASLHLLLWLLLLGLPRLGVGLRVSGLLVPPEVVSGTAVELVCNYHHSPDRDDPLYSISWYRDVNQFYEYIPKRKEPIRVYDLPHIHVDKERSSGATVTITGVTRETSGSFRCEVMGDKPFFETDAHAVNMTVVDVPAWGPTIKQLGEGGKRVKPGTLVKAQCLAGPSDPLADMIWTINGVDAPPHATLHRSSIQRNTQGQPIQVSELQVMATEGRLERGAMILKCQVVVSTVYNTTATLTIVHSDWPQPAEFGWFSAAPSSPRSQGALTPLLMMTLLLLLVVVPPAL